MVSIEAEIYTKVIDFHDMALQLREDMWHPKVKPDKTFTVLLCQFVADYHDFKREVLREHANVLSMCADVFRFTDDNLATVLKTGPVSVDVIKRLRALHRLVEGREAGINVENAAWDIDEPVP